MINPERLALYKKQAIHTVAARAKNPKAPGIAMVAVSPHDLLKMIELVEAKDETDTADVQGKQQ